MKISNTLGLGLTALALSGCPKPGNSTASQTTTHPQEATASQTTTHPQEATASQTANHPQEATARQATSDPSAEVSRFAERAQSKKGKELPTPQEIQAVSEDVQTRYTEFMRQFHQKKLTVQPTAAEIQQFSEGEVAKGMMERYRDFSDRWWGFVHENNRGAAGEGFILPANPVQDPIFTEIIGPLVKGMNLSPEQRRGVLEEYRYRTLTGLRDEMQLLLDTELTPIAPDVMRQFPEALARHEILTANFDALEDRFMYFQYLSFPQILGIEEEKFEAVTTEQEKVVVFAQSLKQPTTLAEAAPLLEEVSEQLDDYQKKLDQLEPSTPEFDDVLQAIMLLMEYQTRLLSMATDLNPMGRVGRTMVVGDEFEAMPVAPSTPRGSFELKIRESGWSAVPPSSGEDVYSGSWSHWAEWYGVSFYYLAMRKFDDLRTQYVQEILESKNCHSHSEECREELAKPLPPFDPMSAWLEGLEFARTTLSKSDGEDVFYGRTIREPRKMDSLPPVYRFVTNHPQLPVFPASIPHEVPAYPYKYADDPSNVPMVSRPKVISVSDKTFAFPAFCEPQKAIPASYDSEYYTLPDHYWGDYHDEWHFDVVMPSAGSGLGRDYYPRNEQTRAVFEQLESMVVGFCSAEQTYQPAVSQTVAMTDWVFPKDTDSTLHSLSIYPKCTSDDETYRSYCEDELSSIHHPIPTAFLEQLARESLAQSFTAKPERSRDVR